MGENKKIVTGRLEKFGVANAALIDSDFEDAFEGLDTHLGGRKVGVYFIDGPHDYRSQMVCLLAGLKHLHDRAVIVIDDANYPDVRQSTADFLAGHPDFKMVFEAYSPAHPANLNEVDRIKFLFLSLAACLWEEDPNTFVGTRLMEDREKTKDFLAKFDEERINRVHRKVESAEKKAKELTGKRRSLNPEDWDWDSYPVECPVCGSDGVLSGETKDEVEIDGVSALYLIGETFECDQCGLSLDDYEEIELAGIEPEADRADIDEWVEQMYGQDDY
ncbi:MAG: class I SAM-dependent methyltransferase [Chloroflexi bacterium]|nr:class I SAM-dependent methyltransferase [Chloroflexota bacterium]